MSQVDSLEEKQAEAEAGDVNSALWLYEEFGRKRNDVEAAKYWLMLAAIHGSTSARVTFSSVYGAETEFSRARSIRWLKEVNKDLLNEAELARLFSLLGRLLEKDSDKESIKYFLYAAVLDPTLFSFSLVEACSSKELYECVYVWGRFSENYLKEDSPYRRRVQEMVNQSFDENVNFDVINKASVRLAEISELPPIEKMRLADDIAILLAMND
ncbi:hypothetical protein KUV95_14785 [Microbulbifer agarilyticus]|uniref:hypothetical protein n=1 Tax=Microbulbifer agarilyticus TaxID=260552 RepID=UPI001C94D142|nr:hypothetical protein [Microbulbifer agarilyticus]MBY6212821.1 hypothetical protein [Microbulbifer agarilyticus]